MEIDMTRALEGIGARLQAEDDYTKVVEIIAGGPAFSVISRTVMIKLLALHKVTMEK
ncbi:MAG: hypothetical protein MZV64_25215 [Ignavibacteriales bacterium]|nr:hypothetical protein [Ignavibacteriales bacterium]